MIQARYPQPSAVIPGRPDDNAFVRKTYAYFSLSLICMLICGVLAYRHLPQDAFIPFAIADGVLWIICGWLGWRNPIAFVFSLFTVITGIFLGLLAGQYAASGLGHVFFNASIATVVAFMALSLYVHVTSRDFSGLLGFLIVGFWILLLSFVLRFFIDITWLQVAFSIFGAIVFSAWILFDTSRIIHQDNSDLTPPIAAFELFLDIIGLYSYIRDLFSIR